jgi:hypothetical protein
MLALWVHASEFRRSIMGTYNLLDRMRTKPASSSDPDLAHGVAFDDP